MSPRERMRPGLGLVAALALLFLAGPAQRGEAQRPEPRVFGGAPAALWIAHPDVPGDAFGVFHFRRTLDLPSRSVRIAPEPGPLRRAEGRVPHPLGDIEVRLERTEDEGLRAEVTLPVGLTGVFEWGGREVRLRPGHQQLEL